MELQKIKTILINLLGQKAAAVIQGVRFAYLLKSKKERDPETFLIKEFLGEGQVAIDVGANGADWTYLLYQSVGSSGHVYAFEADPYYATATKIAIKLMSMQNVILFPLGLSENNEYVPLRVKDTNGLRASGLGYIDKNAEDNTGVEMVQLRALDSFVNEYPEISKVSLIKCDVEGYELFVFKGASEILKKARPIIIMEIGNFEKHGYDSSKVYNFFKGNQYSVYALTHGNYLSETDENMEHKDAVSVNRILLPSEKLSLYSYLIK